MAALAISWIINQAVMSSRRRRSPWLLPTAGVGLTRCLDHVTEDYVSRLYLQSYYMLGVHVTPFIHKKVYKFCKKLHGAKFDQVTEKNCEHIQYPVGSTKESSDARYCLYWPES